MQDCVDLVFIYSEIYTAARKVQDDNFFARCRQLFEVFLLVKRQIYRFAVALLAAEGAGDNISSRFYGVQESIKPDKSLADFYEQKYGKYLKLYPCFCSLAE